VTCASAEKYGVHIVGVEDASTDNVLLEKVMIGKAKTAIKIE